MSDVTIACEKLALSRAQLRAALRASATSPIVSKTPLHIAGDYALDAVEAAVQPMAQRNPFGLVLGAAAVGGVIAWTRPWRWLLTPAILATVLPQLASKAFSHGPPVPWMKLLASIAKLPRRTAKPSWRNA